MMYAQWGIFSLSVQASQSLMGQKKHIICTANKYDKINVQRLI